MRYLFVILFVGMSLLTEGQTGKIRGTVYDDETGETLVGVSIVVKGTTTGTITDLDGKFSLQVKSGTHDLQFSYISYQTKAVENLEVKDGNSVRLDNIRLSESSMDLEEVVVSANQIRTTETALQTIKKKSPVMLDGISASKISFIGDATAVEAAKRITGVSVEDGKYVYVRGLSDRYTKTTLNGIEIPGLDPDRNTLQMDIFPTSLIDNMIVSKNFTADLPADFTGGLVNIETKAFPEHKIIDVSVGTTYNPNVHFNPDYLSYSGSSTDFLGFDDGTRSLPERAKLQPIPTPISSASQQEIVDFIQSFNPNLAAKKQNNIPDLSAGLTLANQKDLSRQHEKKSNNPRLGYMFSVSYKSSYEYDDDIVFGEYQRYYDPDRYEMRYATLQNGQQGEHNVLIGLLGGLAYKTNYSKIRLTATRLQNGESNAGIFNIDNDGEAVGQSGYNATAHILFYSQRSLSNMLLNGTHLFRDSGWEMDWRISPTLSTSDEPDIRRTAFTETALDTVFNAGAGGNPSRIWRSLQEISATAKVDMTRKYQFNNNPAKLKFGVSHTYKQRYYEILIFDMQFNFTQSWSDYNPDNILNPDNLYPNRPNGIYYQSGNNLPNPNEYSSNVNNTAFYISNEMSLLPDLKTVLGIRAENYIQRHTGRDQAYANGDTQNGRNLADEKVLESLDWFPSANFIYSFTSNQNVRASYARTIARPSFKELSFAQILDPISNRIFNGSLFTYSAWDGDLTETRIDNLDLRWELFMPGNQIISVSAFYKNFDDPIELVRIPEQQTSTEYQARNVGDGLLYGAEFEIRKDMGFITPALSNFSMNGNVTYVESIIDMTEVEYNSRKGYERNGETIKDTRKMAGQAPYVINAGARYCLYDAELDMGLFYNIKGPALFIVGAGLFPDIYEQPFHSLNFSFSQKFGKNQQTTIDFKVSNILDNQKRIEYQSYKAENKPFEIYSPGRSFNIGISCTF